MMTEEHDNLPQADGNAEVTQNETSTPEKDHSTEELVENQDKFEAHDQEVPTRNYEELSADGLIAEIAHLVATYPIYKVSKEVNLIRNAFEQKSRKAENEAKAQFVEAGGNEIDFRYLNPYYAGFKKEYAEYKKQLNAHYSTQEKNQKSSLEKREALIEDLKKLYQEPQNSNTKLFEEFRRIRAEWHEAGKIPQANADTIFRTYYHHLDNFYEYLNMNKELQHLDYEHNLEIRHSIIKRAEELVEETHIQKALNELQYLHKLWKEEAVPVAPEHREPTWNKFKEITQWVHDKKDAFYKEREGKEVENIQLKQNVIDELKQINENTDNNHQFFQQNIKKVEALREQFMVIGRAPKSDNSRLWNDFKAEVRDFNKNKNSFYKKLKSDFDDHIEAKKALIEKAKENVNRDDWQEGVQFYKNIQQEWRNSGMVPRRLSDKMWKEFNGFCNQFFENYKNRNQQQNAEYNENYEHKVEYLNNLKSTTFEALKEEEIIEKIQNINKQWRDLGMVPSNKMNINQEFSEVLKEKLTESNANVNLADLQSTIKVNQIKFTGDEYQQQDELRKIKTQMSELNSDIAQLENNLAFFSNVKDDNPLLKNVLKEIENKKSKIDSLKNQYTKIRNINFEEEESPEEVSQPDEQSAEE